ncbi:hypothetical protein ACN5LI_001329, partial [Cronobacter turicensis]
KNPSAPLRGFAFIGKKALCESMGLFLCLCLTDKRSPEECVSTPDIALKDMLQRKGTEVRHKR